MAVTAAEMQILLRARDEASGVVQKFRGELGSIAKSLPREALQGLKSDLGNAGKAMPTAEARRLAGELDNVDRSAGRAGGGVRGLVDGLGKLGMGVFGIKMLAEGVGQMAAGFVAGNIEMENAQAQINAFTKDAAVSKNILVAIRQEADKTPFAFQEMAAATASLIPSAKAANVNLMDVVKTAEILAASHPEQGLRGAAFAIREAVSGDFMSIIDRFDLPRQYINQLKEQGVPNLEIVRRAMLQMGYDADLVANMANTLSGRWSTFQDTLATLKNRLAEPIFDALKGGLERVQTWFDSNQETINEWVARISAGISVVIDVVGELASAFGQAFGMVLDIVSGVGQAIYEALSWINPFASHSPSLVSQVESGVDEIIGSYRRMAGIEEPIGRAADAIEDFKAMGKDALAGIIEGTEAAIDATRERVEAMKEVIGDTKDELNGLKDSVRDAKDALRGLADVPIQGMGEFDAQLDAIKTKSNEVKLQLTQMKLAGAPKEQIEALEAELRRLGLEADRVELEKRLKFDPLQKQIKGVVKPPGGEMAFEDIIKQAKAFKGQIGELEPAIAEADKRLTEQTALLKPLESAMQAQEKVLKAQREAYQDMAKEVKAAGAAVKGAFGAGAGPNKALDAFKDAGNAVDEFKTKVGDARTGIQSAFGKITSAFKGLGSGNTSIATATHLLSGLAFAAGDIGKALTRGDLSGALGKFGRAITTWWIPFWRNQWRIIGDGIGAVGDMAGKVISWLYDNFRKIDWKEVWKVASGIGNAWVAAAGDIIGDVLNWLKETWGKLTDKWPEIWKTAGDIVGGLWTAAGDIAGGVLNWLKEVWKGLSDKWPEIWKLAGDIAGGLRGIALNIGGWIKEQWGKLSDKWPEIWKTAGDIAGGIWKVVLDVTGWLGQQWKDIKWVEVWSNVSNIFATGLTYASKAAKWLGDTWAAIEWSAVWGAVGNFFQGVANIAGQVATWLGLAWGAITAADWATIWKNVSGLGAGLIGAGLDIVEDLTKWLAGQFGQVDPKKVWPKKLVPEGVEDTLKDSKPLHMPPQLDKGWWNNLGDALGGAIEAFGYLVGGAIIKAIEAIIEAGRWGIDRWHELMAGPEGKGVEIDFKAVWDFITLKPVTDAIIAGVERFFIGVQTAFDEHFNELVAAWDNHNAALAGRRVTMEEILAGAMRNVLPPLPESTSEKKANERFTISPEGAYSGKEPPPMTYEQRREEERLYGYQHGGSFRVGGAGGTDSQTVAFRATPGERVTITPAAARAASSTSNSVSNSDNRTVNITNNIVAPNPASVADRFVSDPRIMRHLRLRPVW